MSLLSVGNDMRFFASTVPYICKVLSGKKESFILPSQIRKIIFYLLLELLESALFLLDVSHSTR